MVSGLGGLAAPFGVAAPFAGAAEAFGSAGVAAPLAEAAPFAPALGDGDLLPYQDEYSKEFLNSFFSPQDLQRPSLTAPFGGSITQW